MNFRLLACVTVGVLLAFFAILHIIDASRKLGQPLPPPPPDTGFKTTVIRYQDEKGNDVMRESQYSVPTELAGPDLLKRLPPPPPSAGSAKAAAKTSP